MAAQLRVVQIDAVNVLVRSHYLPVYARAGAYDQGVLDGLAYTDHELFEYSGHALSLLTVDHHPLMRWRMEEHRRQSWEPTRAAIEQKRPGYVDTVMAEIQERGPLSWTDLTDAGREEKRPTKYAESSIAWWRWSVGKDVLTHLTRSGDLAVAGRRNFEALYDLPERAIPAEVLALPTPDMDDAHRELVRRSVVALGVGNAKDVADYYRLPVAATKARLKELVEEGAVAQARVEGWKDPAWLDATAKVPRTCEAHALLSPFDSLIWERKRTERIFDFKVSFEIYVPPPKRTYGYYVLAFLMGDAIVARVDLKADRTRRTLLAPGAFLEPGKNSKEVAAALALRLEDLAAWLALESVEIGAAGNLSKDLQRALPRPRRSR